MKRLTKNRIDIMRCLTEGSDDCGLPPYSVSSVHYMLYGFSMPRDKAREKTQMNQIRRTLNELVIEGIAIVEKRKNYEGGDLLPFWENVYQIASMVEANLFEQELKDIKRTIEYAYNGTATLFGGKPNGKGLTEKEIQDLTKRVRSIIQKSHPDKASGNVYRFKVMKNCLNMLKSMPIKK